MYRCGNNNKTGTVTRSKDYKKNKTKMKPKSKQDAIKSGNCWRHIAILLSVHLSHSHLTASQHHSPENFRVFICGILRIYLFRLPSHNSCLDEISATFNPRPHFHFTYNSEHFLPHPLLPHPLNAVATSVTRFSLFPIQFFRCVPAKRTFSSVAHF